MGAIWLLNLPKWLQEEGLNVSTEPGWETRSRGSGGYDAIMGVGLHHDAGPTSMTFERRTQYEWYEAAAKPIGAIHLHSDGRIRVGAAGATNTQGLGGPYRTSKGTIPLDSGNRYMISIEASNNGTGQVWPEVQLDAYRRICKVLCMKLGLNPLTDLIAHFEWTPRKIDPAGQSRYAVGSNKWNMVMFRSDVKALIAASVPPPIVTPPSSPIEVGELMELQSRRLYDSRNGKGASTLFAVQTGLAGAKAVQVSITTVAIQPGRLSINAETNFMTFDGGDPAVASTGGTILQVQADGNILFGSTVSTHVIVDLVGVYR